MNTTTSKTMIMALLVISMATLSANAESMTNFLAPQKQIAMGTSAPDVICNSGLALVAKLSTGSAACVKPSSALKLEKIGWGQILKDSTTMNDIREKMIAKINQENEHVYDPQLNPTKFVSEINNRFLTLTPGTLLIYQAQVEEGTERIEYLVTDEKRNVMGVETTVVWDREWLNEDLIEDTKDWFAQDNEGNVWYFGEDSKEYSGGKLVSTKGSWEAGVDGAKPGIIMMGSPQVGETYRQEYYKGQAEDMGQVLSLDANVSISFGTFSGCLKTKDWTPLEPNSVEFKYYCPQIGNVVLEEKQEDNESVELIQVTSSKDSTKEQEVINETPVETPSEISEDEAIQIASEAYEGTVTDIGTEYKFGKFAWVIEMQTSQGEIDVVIDKNTGEILGVET
jgi:hypothetical protein